ncbi:hypothetical protein P3H15_31200 [Rhodococcus sp. T2V]|uniref:hypothetical protein n=1 Tax=Rhodococcus sp. T2V TaxID=3034164 RepID=UPI0023E12062|nr:hypothetical protein [Rhodococcus sp. T2V]MDF3309487.1 hypothetical protein [Rhodococcus sp. T2V]
MFKRLYRLLGAVLRTGVADEAVVAVAVAVAVVVAVAVGAVGAWVDVSTIGLLWARARWSRAQYSNQILPLTCVFVVAGGVVVIAKALLP